jgi:hypothetical protein
VSMASSTRRFRPGHRDNPQLRGTGKMSDTRRAWLKTAIGQFVILEYGTGDEDHDKEHGPTVKLHLPRPGRPPVNFNLTALTAEELKLTREFFNLLFDMAEPIVDLRDKVAHDALADGDDSYARVYRAVPQFVIRKEGRSEDTVKAYTTDLRVMLMELEETSVPPEEFETTAARGG